MQKMTNLKKKYLKKMLFEKNCPLDSLLALNQKLLVFRWLSNNENRYILVT
jgi:hypothetical protein